jgi:hypothetical protein
LVEGGLTDGCAGTVPAPCGATTTCPPVGSVLELADLELSEVLLELLVELAENAISLGDSTRAQRSCPQE